MQQKLCVALYFKTKMAPTPSQNSSAPTGKLYLIPVPLAPDSIKYLPEIVLKKAPEIKFYFVEKLKTARRFLKAMNRETDIDAISFSEIGRHDTIDIPLLEKWLYEGHEIGIMSEAGCPGVADPGSLLVQHAHKIGAKVIPLPGPNSMLLALMSSGFNGQAYRFSGYLPVKEPERTRTIKGLEQRSAKFQETQIFMETPYRNNQLLRDLLATCLPSTKIGIACDLNMPTEFIRTLPVKDWHAHLPDLHKRPTVFTLFAE